MVTHVRRWTGVILSSTALLGLGFSAPASADVVDAPSTATASAIQTAAGQAAATTAAGLEQNVAQVQPSVDAALAPGGEAEHLAVQQMLASNNQALAAALLNDSQQYVVGGSTMPLAATATGLPTSSVTVAPAVPLATVRCWPTEVTTINDGPDPADIIAWRSVRAWSWCGNGSTITSNSGFKFNSHINSANPYYCWAGSPVQSWAWDGSHAWIHGRNWESLGGNYVVGCLALQELKPVIRIAANGYWDSYNDF